MGDLAYWMDENFLMSLYASTGEVLNTKIIRNKVTGYSEGYGFVEFASNFAAQNVLNTYNGAPIAGTDQFFKLNWASYSGGQGGGGGAGGGGGVKGGGGAQENGALGESSEHSVFVGDLSPEVTDYMLQEFFRQYYPSVKSARVVTDPVTGRPKGYGFVRFMNEGERDKAMLEMSGQVVGSRPIRVSLATPKRSGGSSGAGYQPPASFQNVGMGMAYPPMMNRAADMHAGADTSNTTLYVGGIAPSTKEEDIRAVFSDFGEIVYIKIASGKACAFVQFAHRANAEKALIAANGYSIKGNAVRVSWGRHSEPQAMMPASNPYATQVGYYGYYYDPNQYYGYGMHMQSPPTMVQMQGMPSPQQAAAAQIQSDGINRESSISFDNTTKPPSVEEMNKSYSSITAPYTVGSNAFISSVPPTPTSALQQ